jgi:hypothetical protein
MDEKRKQVADQCRVVAHLAKAIWEVYSDKARMFASDMTGPNDIVDLVGNNSARHMNKLGDILNGMDAVEDDDAWTDPIFERAKQQFPEATAAGSAVTSTDGSGFDNKGNCQSEGNR